MTFATDKDNIPEATAGPEVKPTTITTNKRKCIIWARVSTDEQTVENQLSALREYAAAQGWEVIAQYSATYGHTGNENCQQWNNLVATLHDQWPTVPPIILCWALDRLPGVRKGGSLGALQGLQFLHQMGAEVVFARQPELSMQGPFRDVIIALLGALARMEREMIKDRTVAALKRKGKYNPKTGRISWPGAKRGKDKNEHGRKRHRRTKAEIMAARSSYWGDPLQRTKTQMKT